jgi:hypothetical protein
MVSASVGLESRAVAPPAYVARLSIRGALRLRRLATGAGFYRPSSGTNASALFAFIGMTSWFAPES